jgi:hypothetical protein
MPVERTGAHHQGQNGLSGLSPGQGSWWVYRGAKLSLKHRPSSPRLGLYSRHSTPAATVVTATSHRKLATPRTFEPLGFLQIERYWRTQCAPVCLNLNNSKRFKRSRGRKFRRSGVSQSEPFVIGGMSPTPVVCRSPSAGPTAFGVGCLLGGLITVTVTVVIGGDPTMGATSQT